MLVKHRTLNRLKIMVFEMDPWLPNSDPKRHFVLLALNTNQFSVPSYIAFEDLKKAELLIGRDANDRRNFVLLL